MSKSGKCAYNFTVSSHKYDYFNIIIRFNFLIHADFSNMKIHVVSMHELSKPWEGRVCGRAHNLPRIIFGNYNN